MSTSFFSFPVLKQFETLDELNKAAVEFTLKSQQVLILPALQMVVWEQREVEQIVNKISYKLKETKQ